MTAALFYLLTTLVDLSLFGFWIGRGLGSSAEGDTESIADRIHQRRQALLARVREERGC